MVESYLSSIVKQFLYYKKLAEGAMAQLADEQLYWQYNEESNSVAIIIQHMGGNMLSRFTDFLTTDGEKVTRNRDQEFDARVITREELMEQWERGWLCLFRSLESLTTEQLETIVYIRNEGHTVVEALNRQLAHYPYHVGQIVFIAKMLVSENWQSLSIPKNKSVDYNAQKFVQEKSIKHFTDDL